MSEKQQDNSSTAQSGIGAVPGELRYRHEAMATTFEIFIVHNDPVYAEQAAWAAFDELDRLEKELSRFVENSDISRLNALPPNQPLLLGPEAFNCLRLAQQIYHETDGAFDVTIGSLMACLLNKDKSLRSPTQEELKLAREMTGLHLVLLDESEFTVQLAREGVQVDLGGIGKGYAVDRMAALLREWGIDTALIHGGSSSILAMDGPPGTKGWPLTISNPDNCQDILMRIDLKNQALSGSGLRKGRHIIDPRSARPVEDKVASWALVEPGANTILKMEAANINDQTEPDATPATACLKPDMAFSFVGCHYLATWADALSTAFMVMSPRRIKQFCRKHRHIKGMIALEEKGTASEKRIIVKSSGWVDE
ncbi:MAG: FAD:protein FMN transferase [Sedimentisphaerales bacterium]|nr:FAD:protein FMN transferase [Sedimentisphaerales bacterium]